MDKYLGYNKISTVYLYLYTSKQLYIHFSIIKL